MAIYAYSNNGLSYRMVEPGWPLEPGEVVFDAVPSPSQLAAAFPDYPGAVAAPSVGPLVIASYVARLQGQAALRTRQGKSAAATALQLKAMGALING